MTSAASPDPERRKPHRKRAAPAIDLGGRYESLRELGRGGSGLVLLVRDRFLGMDLALKLLDPAGDSRPVDVEELRGEFAILTSIDHPGIARAHDFGILDGRPFYTREFVPGEPLGRLEDPGEILEVARGVAAALAVLHDRQVLHLDVKPGNIILSRASGGGLRPVLIDFGLHRRGRPAPSGRTVKGSLPFMAPEQLRGGPLGPWTDVYALGATLYRAATGAFPRAGHLDAGRPVSGRGWEPVVAPPSDLAPRVPEDLGRVILKCLALDPASRFAGARDLLEALERISGGREAAPPAGGVSPRTVGRAEEIARIAGFLERLAAPRDAGPDGGAPRRPVLVITGPQGMGATHLIREAKVIAQTRGLRFYLETGYPGIPAHPGGLLACLGAHLPAGDRRRVRWEEFLARLSRPRRTAGIEALEAERRLRRAAEAARIAESIAEPVVLAVDGLQFWDEVSVGLVADLARLLTAPSGEAWTGSGGPSPGSREAPWRPPLGLILGLREEGTAAALIRELTGHLARSGSLEVVTLKPLGLPEAIDLFRDLGGPEPEDGGLAVYRETEGAPARISVLARGGAKTAAKAIGTPPERGRDPAAGLDRLARDVLLISGILGRPAREEEIGRAAGRGRADVRRAIEALAKRGLIEPGSRPRSWIAGSEAARAADGLSPPARRSFHRRIGIGLCRGRLPASDPCSIEGVRHLKLAGAPSLLTRHGLPAARWLKATFQNRAALELYRDVLEAIPPPARRRRVEVLLEMAELEAGVGGLEAGIGSLQSALEGGPGLPPALRARLLLWLATLHTRKGDLRRAGALFEEGFRTASRGGPSIEERLFFLNENASLEAVSGNPSEARRLCEEGLRLAGAKRGRSVREGVLTLLATRASVSMRALDTASAIRDLEEALEIAEAIGSPANGAVILNNLATVYTNCDRYREAIAAFREAEAMSLRLDEGPSLVSIQGNLGLLFAKTGDFAASAKAFEDARRILPAGVWKRQEHFHHHTRGLAAVYRGRFAEAREALEASIRIGEEIGDRLFIAFDRLFRAEALIFLGRHGEAWKDLDDLALPGGPERVRKMALSRKAFLAAWTGSAAALDEARRMHGAVSPAHPVPFLDAWDDLYLGWALSIRAADRPEVEGDALRLLRRAQEYFAGKGLAPALALARWIEAEGRLLRGDAEKTLDLVRADRTPGNELTAVLRPLLELRVLLERSGRDVPPRAGDLLSEAGAALVGNPLPEWSLRLEALRAAAGGGGRSLAALEREREKTALDLPEAARGAYRLCASWKIWTAPARGGRALRAPGRRGRSAGAATAPLARTGRFLRGGLVARSKAMGELLAALDRIGGRDLPVLIVGETGTGKELVARTIHAESRRSAGPFLVIDPGAIPPGLVEVELLGARAGAFTDLKRDRPGLIAAARGGTVLLDGIAALPLEVQAKLLRILEGGTYRRIGDEAESRADARFLFSTSTDLGEEVRAGRFRRDLFHRMEVLTVRVPPLRERAEDIPDLAALFLTEGPGPAPRLGPGVLDRLAALPWPGNVRELRNLLVRLRLEDPRAIRVADIERVRGSRVEPIVPPSLLARESLRGLKERLERDYLLHHIERLGGDTAELARLLGLGRRQLFRRLRKLGLRLRQSGGRRRPPP